MQEGSSHLCATSVIAKAQRSCGGLVRGRVDPFDHRRIYAVMIYSDGCGSCRIDPLIHRICSDDM